MKQLLGLAFVLASWISFSQTAPQDSVRQKPVCPVCNSNKDVIPIIYGKPAAETIKRAEKGECRLGGCMIDKDSPYYYCKKDKKEFGK